MAKVMSTTHNKSTKTRRETAVQGTNDSSIVSKWSTAACGYFDDCYLQHFISKQSRRAPLIHRGYYIRAAAFDKLIKTFLQNFQNSQNQIISLGAGFDSTYFRLKGAKLLSNTFFCEIDFPELVRRKRLLIENSPELSNLVQKCDTPPLSPHIELSCTDYQLLGVDLTQLNTVEAALKMCGVNFDCPTLLLSECVLTYMTRRCSTELVKWAAETFEQAVFGIYEQVNPDDAFGLFMQAHFSSIGSPLKCINSFPSLQSQEDRFLHSGWNYSEAVDMNTFYYHCLDQSEQDRVKSIETFDEYEELNLKYSHYFILTASTSNLNQSLITNGTAPLKCASTKSLLDHVEVSRLPESDESVRRFGHASSLVKGRFVVTSGGFGETDGRHQRLAELTITDLSTMKSYHVPCDLTDMQIPRMHHSSVALSNGTTILIGGRQSPYFVCNQMLKVTLQLNSSYDTFQTFCSSHNYPDSLSDEHSLPAEDVHLNSEKDQRKLVDSVQEEVRQSSLNSKSCAMTLTGTDHSVASKTSLMNPKVDAIPPLSNKSENSIHLGDSETLSQSLHFGLGNVTIEVVDQKGNIPKERWRHASVVITQDGEEKIFLYGGKTKSGEVLQDSFIFSPQTNTWTECLCSGNWPGPRHSHCLTFWQGRVILTGGLDKSQVPTDGIFSLDLSTMVWEKWYIDGPLYARYSHTAHLYEDMLLLVGGVNTEQKPPGLAVISLTSFTALEFEFPVQDKHNLLMLHRHTSVMPQDHTGKANFPLVLLGGGGNCFSFGTHLNRTPVLVDVARACACLQQAQSS